MTYQLPNPSNPHAASNWDVSVIGGLAILPIRGTVFGGRTWGCSIPEALFALANSPQTQTVLLDIDCYGGELNGFDDIRRGLEVLRAAGKKSVAIAHDRAYSLGAMIGMLCDDFVCTPSAEVGQLGVVRSIIDQSKYAAEQGLEEWVSTSDPTRKVGGLSPIPDGLKSNLIALDTHTWMMVSDLIAAARGLDPDALRAMGAEIMHPQAALATGIVTRVESFDVLVGELMDASLTVASVALPGQTTRAGRAVASGPSSRPNPGFLPRIPQELIMSTRTLLSSIGLAASALIPGPSAAAPAIAGRTPPPLPGSLSVGKAKAAAEVEDAAEEMTEEEIEAKFPKAAASMKAKAAAAAAKAAVEAAAAEASASAKKDEAKASATPATIGELKAAFPDDPAFCFTCLEQGLDMQAALLGKVKAQADQIAALKAAAPPAGPTGPVTAKPAATAPAIASSASIAGRIEGNAAAGGLGTGQTPETFDQAVQMEIASAMAR